MEARAFGSGSLGCHCSPDKAAAKKVACSPVPAATSRRSPRDGSASLSTARSGSRLRAVAGACSALFRFIIQRFLHICFRRRSGALRHTLGHGGIAGALRAGPLYVESVVTSVPGREEAMTACIVGWAHTPFGKHEKDDAESLIAQVATQAVADAGLDPADIDEIVLGTFGEGFSA